MDSHKETITALKWRYACKKFDPKKKLSNEKLEILKEAFNLTATSYGLQPLKMLIIGDENIKQQLPPISMNQNQVKDASHVLVLCTEMNIHKEYIETYFDRVEAIRDTPKDILEPFEDFLIHSFSKKSTEEINLWMTKQAYLAMGNLLTVCAIEKIDSCPMEGFEPEKYDKLLGLKERGLQSVLVMPVGYRHKDDKFSTFKKVRRGVDKVIIDL